MRKELITKKDYEILAVTENSTPDEINSAYEKLCLEYHPEKIKLEKLREPTEFELKKYQEIEKVYKKFDVKHNEYTCCGYKEKHRPCTNMFYPCLWKKVEGGQKKYFCSQECYNSKYESSTHKSSYKELIEKWQKEDEEWRKKKFEEAKKSLEDWKRSDIQDIQKELNSAQIKVEDLEPNNRNFEQEINAITIKNSEDQEWVSKLGEIQRRVEKDIWSKSKRDLQTCDYCHKSFKGQWDGHGYVSYGAVGKDGHKTFCSEECREKGMKGKWITVARKNAFAELLKWMEKEGITNLTLDPKSGKLVVEYGQNNSKTIEDDNLTSEQKEIREFLRQTGKNHLSQSQVREEVAREGKNGDNNKWLEPVVGIGIVALIITLIGVIIYKNKKKNY